MNDYKYDIQILAEQLADEKFGKDFDDLTDAQQDGLYREAEGSYWERRQLDAERD